MKHFKIRNKMQLNKPKIKPAIALALVSFVVVSSMFGYLFYNENANRIEIREMLSSLTNMKEDMETLQFTISENMAYISPQEEGVMGVLGKELEIMDNQAKYTIEEIDNLGGMLENGSGGDVSYEDLLKEYNDVLTGILNITNNVDSVNNQIDGEVSYLQNLTSENHKEQIEELKVIRGSLEESNQAFTSNLDTNFKTINTNFEKMDKLNGDGFGTLNEMLEKTNSNIEKTNSEIEKQNESNTVGIIKTLSENNASLNSKLDESNASLNSKIDNNNANLNNKLDENNANLNNKIDENNANLVNKLDESKDSLADKIDDKHALLSMALEDDFGVLNEDLQSFESRISSQITTFKTELNENIGNNQEALVSNLSETREALEQKIEDCQAAIESKMDTQKAALEGKMDSQTSTLQGNLDSVKDNVNGSIETLGTNVSGKIETLETSVGDMVTSQTSSINESIAVTNGKIDTNATKLTSLQTDMETLKSDVGTLKNSLSDGKKKLTNAITGYGVSMVSTPTDGVYTFDEIKSGIDNLKVEYDPKTVVVEKNGDIVVKNVNGTTKLTTNTGNSYEAGYTQGFVDGKSSAVANVKYYYHCHYDNSESTTKHTSHGESSSTRVGCYQNGRHVCNSSCTETYSWTEKCNGTQGWHGVTFGGHGVPSCNKCGAHGSGPYLGWEVYDPGWTTSCGANVTKTGTRNTAYHNNGTINNYTPNCGKTDGGLNRAEISFN